MHILRALGIVSGLPSAPNSLQVDYLTRDSVTLNWSRPSDTGGVPLSGYVIEALEGKSTRWRVVAYVEPHRMYWTVHGLIQGYEYQFCVRAENPDGVGPPTVLHTPIIPKPVVCKLNTNTPLVP